MRKLYTSVLGLSALLFSAAALGQTSTTFNYTGSIQTYTVPAGVFNISIEANGAQGGTNNPSFPGGLGANIYGEFSVTPGQVIDILVGEQGYPGTVNAAGGGGGSFVVDDATDTPLLIAGGGSGGTSTVAGNDGLAGEDGGDGDGCAGNGGTGGNGGGDAAACGNGTGGAGGFYTDGSSASSWGSQRGYAYLNGGAGGTSSSGSAHGGYGGGGGTHSNNTGGGPGGGYSGGGAANHGGAWAGGGGGSYNAGTSPVNTAGVNAGDGSVIITELCFPVTVTVSSDTICYGDELTLTATSSISGTLTWDNGAPNGTAFTPDTTGLVTYTTSSDTLDCETAAMVLIQEAPEFTLDATDELAGGDGTASITLTGGTFPFTYDWDNDGTGDFDDDANQTGLTAGWYTVTVMSGNGCTWTDSVQVSSQLSIEEFGNNISLFPNPTTDNITLSGMNAFTYAIVDAQGKVVMTGEGGEEENISLTALESGIYVIKVEFEGVAHQARLIKQ